MDKSYANLKKIAEKNSEVEFEAEIPVAVIDIHRQKALAEAAANFEMPGFRKGKVSMDVVKQYVDENDLLEKAANAALRDAIPEIVVDEKLDVMGKPDVTLVKIAPKEAMTFKIRFALFPEITLPDYKKIGMEINARVDSTESTDKDVEDAIGRIRLMISNQAAMANPGGENPLPEVNDEFAQRLGAFKNVDELKAELKRQLAQEKEIGVKNAKREEIAKEIVKKSKLKIPELMMDQEVARFKDERDAELEKAGLSLDEYLKQVNKTAEALEKEERQMIEEQIKMSLVLGEIRKKENISAEDKEIRATAINLKMHYPDRDEKSLHRAAEAVIIQEKLFDIFNLKEKEEVKTGSETKETSKAE